MSMAAHDPQLPGLELADLIHTMSPSPTPLQPDLPRSSSPEHLTETDIAHMRHRAAELSHKSKGTEILSDTEKELLAMVRRLTESTLLDPSQLIHQAEIISGLSFQRDFLVRQAEEERERWASQKDGWERMAEALIAQRNKTTSIGTKDPELERYCAAYESDNRALREKLNDTQTRLQCLEAELTKLRPILLMQPVTSQSISQNSTSSVPYPSIQAAAEKAKPKKKKKKEARAPVFTVPMPEEQEVSDDQPETPQQQHPMEGVVEQGPPSTSTSSSAFFQFQAQPIQPPLVQPSFTGDHYRKPTTAPIGGPLTAPPTTLEFQVHTPAPPIRTIRRVSSPSSGPGPGPSTSTSATTTATAARPGAAARTKSSRRLQGAPLTPLTSDARTEHLLLAARKIGRERAGIVAGYVRDRQREAEVQRLGRERERTAANLERLERERAERMAERGAGGLSYYRRDVVEAGAGIGGGGGKGGGKGGGSPETPKRGSRSSHYPNVDLGGSPRVMNTSFVIVEPAKIGARGDGRGGGYGAGSGNLPNTPRQHQAATESQQAQAQGLGNPPTPLASLLDAARMMNDDDVAGSRNGAAAGKGRRNGVSHGGSTSGSGVGRRRSAAEVDQVESPVPKRRRVASARAAATANHSNGGGGGGGGGREKEEREGLGLGRVKSALDVLADQAAAFSSHDQRGKGKARERGRDEDEDNEDVDVDVDDESYAPVPTPPPKKGRGRARAPAAKEKEREKEREKAKVKTKTKTKMKPALTRKARVKVAAAAAPTVAVNTGFTPPAPRMISPPGPKASTMLQSLASVSGSGSSSSRNGSGSGSGSASATGVSPMDTLPPNAAQPVSSGGEGIDPAVHGNAKYGFQPAAWGRRGGDVSEEASSSSPVRPEKHEHEPVKVKECGGGNAEEERAGAGGEKEDRQGEHNDERVRASLALEPPVEMRELRSSTDTSPVSGLTQSGVEVGGFEEQQEQAGPAAESEEMSWDVEMGVDLPEAETDVGTEVQPGAVVQEVDNHIEAIPSTDQTPIGLETLPDVATRCSTEPELPEGASQSTLDQTSARTQHEEQQVTTEQYLRKLDAVDHPSTPPPPSPTTPHPLHIDSQQQPPLEANEDKVEVEADPDADVDAEADIDDGEADAEGEVDAEGEFDLEVMETPPLVVSDPASTSDTSPLPLGMPNGSHRTSAPLLMSSPQDQNMSSSATPSLLEGGPIMMIRTRYQELLAAAAAIAGNAHTLYVM